MFETNRKYETNMKTITSKLLESIVGSSIVSNNKNKFFELVVRFQTNGCTIDKNRVIFYQETKKISRKIRKKKETRHSGQNVLRIDFERFHTVLEPG